MTALARVKDFAPIEQAIVHVIDDDVSITDALGLMLPSVGLDVRTYASVQEFLDAHEHDGPGCIVLDVRLPGISGLDFQSRRDRLGIHLPIVLMTGHSDVPMSVRAMKAGAIDFLPKPFRDQDMIDAVIAALLLKMLWQPIRRGEFGERDLETAAFTIFLYPRMLGCAAEIDDHLNRGRNMDTRTVASSCKFVA